MFPESKKVICEQVFTPTKIFYSEYRQTTLILSYNIEIIKLNFNFIFCMKFSHNSTYFTVTELSSPVIGHIATDNCDKL